jgi:hypothetical protein
MNSVFLENYKTIIQQPRLYIDYESNKAGKIYLVGFQYRDSFTQVITDPELEGLANQLQFKVADPVDQTIQLLNTAIRDNAVIVAYSEAEKQIFQNLLCNIDITQYSDLVYLNLLKATKSWINKYMKQAFDELPPFRKNATAYYQRSMQKSLASIMRLTPFNAPADYAPLKTTARLNTIASALIKRNQRYEILTPTQKRKGTQALKHNEFDVKALPILFETIYSKDQSCFKKSLKRCFE